MTQQEILQIAKRKASGLQNNQQIRVCGAELEKSYWVFNFAGSLFIGSVASEPLPPFFKGNAEYTMSDKNGNKVGALQKLFI